jgi:phosphoribosylformylglycinamidine synthase
MPLAEIHVTLKPTLLDAQGATVLKALRHLGHEHVHNVRIGKHIVVEMDDALSETALQSELELMCRQLLSNPVIEDYSISVGGAPVGSGATVPTPLDIGSETVSPLAAATDATTTAPASPQPMSSPTRNRCAPLRQALRRSRRSFRRRAFHHLKRWSRHRQRARAYPS